jgi:hypothetical protein
MIQLQLPISSFLCNHLLSMNCSRHHSIPSRVSSTQIKCNLSWLLKKRKASSIAHFSVTCLYLIPDTQWNEMPKHVVGKYQNMYSSGVVFVWTDLLLI